MVVDIIDSFNRINFVDSNFMESDHNSFVVVDNYDSSFIMVPCHSWNRMIDFTPAYIK